MSDAFRTFQTVKTYEDALARHGQWVRWTRALRCPCFSTITNQPDPHHTLCKGRGFLYRTPGAMQVFEEIAKHDSFGKIYPLNTPWTGTPTVWRQGSQLTLATVQPSTTYIQIDPPYPRAWQEITINYEFTKLVSVVDEDSEVYGTNTLRTIATRFSEKGKTFEGSIESVSKVYNVDKTENYTVSSFAKEYIYLTGMGTYAPGDTLEVSYDYVAPFDFIILGVTPKIRWEQPYVLEEADATLITPYWAQVAPSDLLTALSQEQIGQVVIDPTVSSGNDEVTGYFDLSRLRRVMDINGIERSVGPGNDVELFERNELKWNVTKPTIPFMVEFTYHPTYSALRGMHTLRNAENKAFVNRLGLLLFDKVNTEVVY